MNIPTALELEELYRDVVEVDKSYLDWMIGHFAYHIRANGKKLAAGETLAVEVPNLRLIGNGGKWRKHTPDLIRHLEELGYCAEVQNGVPLVVMVRIAPGQPA